MNAMKEILYFTVFCSIRNPDSTSCTAVKHMVFIFGHTFVWISNIFPSAFQCFYTKSTVVQSNENCVPAFFYYLFISLGMSSKTVS